VLGPAWALDGDLKFVDTYKIMHFTITVITAVAYLLKFRRVPFRILNFSSGVVDWSGGMFASCTTRVQLYVNACNWMAAVCSAAPLALAKQLPLPRL